MQKKSKTILTAVLTALFVLSVSYFALLAPTTAWYYQAEDKTLEFDFGDFDMTPALQTGEESIATITLRGATRFADAGETLFDEMLHIVKIRATNNGDTPGSVRVSVQQNGADLRLDNAAGLRWFVFDPALGSVKSQIDAMLTAWNPDWPIDYNDLTGNESVTYTDYDQMKGEAESAYEEYNLGTSDSYGNYSDGAMEALMDYNRRGVTVPDNDAKDVYVAFWAEYGAAKSELNETLTLNETMADGSHVSVRNTSIPSLTFSNLTIKISAMPDIGGTDTTSLTISNTASSAVTVLLYRYTSDWVPYSYEQTVTVVENETTELATEITSVIQIGAHGSKQLSDLPVGARFKAVIQGNAAVHFNSGTGLDVSADGKTISGALSNASNSISIAANTGS